MIRCECLHTDGSYYEEYAYTLAEFPFFDLPTSSRTGYASEFMTFDIETSNVDENGYKYGFMYHWQACICGLVCFGRTWQQFIAFMHWIRIAMNLDASKRLVIYVHNLSFEFHFLYDFLNFEQVFAVDAHKVLKATAGPFEFRCSYMLSNMSLAKFIENSEGCTHAKGVDDLDYRQLRTPDTVLKPRQNGYCFNDVYGLWEAINYRLRSDSLKSIPITSTGYVRRACRQAMRKNRKNREHFLDWQINADLYRLIKQIFRGGNTASNRYLATQILDDVGSYDLSSAYPFAMVAYKYPTKFMEYDIDDMEQYKQLIDRGYAIIGRFRFDNLHIKANTPIAYVPFSKCLGVAADAVVYNGRILSASWVVIALTEIDFQIIEQEYTFDDVAVASTYISVKEYLPDEFVSTVFDYFEKKSKLKNDKDHVYEYVKAKNSLNSLYGMIATDIVREEILFKDGDFIPDVPVVEYALEKYYKSRNSFLTYQWGMYVTAYTRMLLEQGLQACGLDAVYCDTDSVKFIGDHAADFDRINDQVRTYCAKHGRKYSIEINGNTFEMGVFDEEPGYDRFITLGAKKYAYEDAEGVHITVAGLNKKKGAAELAQMGGLEAFQEGTIFHDSGRTTATYNNEPIHWIRINGEQIMTASNIAIFDTTYELGITDTMREILFDLQNEK